MPVEGFGGGGTRPLGQREGVGDGDKLVTAAVCVGRQEAWRGPSLGLPTARPSPLHREMSQNPGSEKTRCLQLLAKYGDRGYF